MWSRETTTRNSFPADSFRFLLLLSFPSFGYHFNTLHYTVVWLVTTTINSKSIDRSLSHASRSLTGLVVLAGTHCRQLRLSNQFNMREYVSDCVYSIQQKVLGQWRSQPVQKRMMSSLQQKKNEISATIAVFNYELEPNERRGNKKWIQQTHIHRERDKHNQKMNVTAGDGLRSPSFTAMRVCTLFVP